MRARWALTVGLAIGLWIAPAAAQNVTTLRLHHFLPPQASVPQNFLVPWAQKIEDESNGRLKVVLFPSMQLGGTPPQLFDQVKDGVVDIVWTLPGYTPGRFPKAEVFELPFIAANGEQSSQAAWDFYTRSLRDEFSDVHVLAVHTHGPGIIHAKGQGVRRLEDMTGLRVRGPTRMVNKLLQQLGATSVAMPVPTLPDALDKSVAEAAVAPWEVTAPLRLAELVRSHTGFSGNRSLYVSLFVLAMNKSRYAALPAELRKVIDDNSGLAASQWAGRVMDEGDAVGLAEARTRGNEIIALAPAETARWKVASQKVVDEWIAEMATRGIDGKALVEDVRRLIVKYAGAEG